MNENPAQDSCAMPENPAVLKVSTARQTIVEMLSAINCQRKLAIRDALQQILAEAIVSPVNVPPHANSAMDGYAMAYDDLQAHSYRLQLAGSAFAGQPFNDTVKAGQCVRIMTGAVLPQGCDTVIMQENADVDAETIRFHGQVDVGQNVRLAGEDIQYGQQVLPVGRRLQPADLGLLASLGIAEVMVKRPLRVAFFSTGNELKSIGEPLAAGDIYDSNRYTLFAMLKKCGVDSIDMGVVKDSPDALREALQSAAEHADMVITSGGVSVGEADYIKTLLAELGRVNFWKIAMKPGRPLAFGHLGDTPFFGLPGNPVSVMVTFYQFVLPALQKMAGEIAEPLLHIPAVAETAIRKRPGRFEFQRGIFKTNTSGQLQVTMTGEQGSGILSSMSSANCFILLDEACAGVAAGETVTIQPFAGLI